MAVSIMISYRMLVEESCITEITKQEFVLYMLKTTKAVSEGDVTLGEGIFRFGQQRGWQAKRR